MKFKLSKKRPVNKETKSWYKRGEYKGYQVAINYNEPFHCYYYQIVKGEFSYSSLWEDGTFGSEEICTTECVKYIDKREGD